MKQERWFDGDWSEAFYGMGHQDPDDFAWWVLETEVNEHGITLQEARDWIDPTQVEHIWVYWVDKEPHEQFAAACCTADTAGAFAVTRLQI